MTVDRRVWGSYKKRNLTLAMLANGKWWVKFLWTSPEVEPAPPGTIICRGSYTYPV